MTPAGGRLALGTVLGVAAATWAAPAVTALAPLRRAAFPALSGTGSSDHVAVTFDDGPDPASTPAFIRALDRLQVRATFFLLGRMLCANPRLGHELVEAGHEVALHGWDHRMLIARGAASTRQDLTRAHEEVTRICGVAPTHYRPPYGVLTWPALCTAHDLGMRPVLWTTWGRDWRRAATAQSVLGDVVRHLGPGGTILLHDSDCTSAPGSWRNTLEALPDIIGHIRERDLTPGPLLEHGICTTARPQLERSTP